MTTFSYVGPSQGEKSAPLEVAVAVPPVSVTMPPFDWQPLLDAMAASQERGEYKLDSMLASIDELACNLKFPAPQITVAPQVAAPAVTVEVIPPIEVTPKFLVQFSDIAMSVPKSLFVTALLSALALLVIAGVLSFQLYASLGAR